MAAEVQDGQVQQLFLDEVEDVEHASGAVAQQLLGGGVVLVVVLRVLEQLSGRGDDVLVLEKRRHVMAFMSFVAT